MKLAVAGTGYVGLSIATLLAQHHEVMAVDIIEDKVNKINNKISPIQDDYIEKYLKEMGIKVNTTTVYRYLDKLCAEHVVIKYPDLNSDKAVFQFAGEEKKCTDHLHLKCIRCGKVVHLDCDFMDELKEHLFRDHGFRLQCSGDMLHGICKDCENKSDQL